MFERTRPVKQWGHYFVVRDDDVSADRQPIDPQAMRRVMANRRAEAMGELRPATRIPTEDRTVLEISRTSVSTPRLLPAEIVSPVNEPTPLTSLQPVYTRQAPVVVAPYTRPTPSTEYANSAISPAPLPSTVSAPRVPYTSVSSPAYPPPPTVPFYPRVPYQQPPTYPTRPSSATVVPPTTSPSSLFYPEADEPPPTQPYTPASPQYASRGSAPSFGPSTSSSNDFVKTPLDEGQEMVVSPLYDGGVERPLDDDIAMEITGDQTPAPSTTNGWLIAAGVAAIILGGLYARQEGWI